MQLATQLSTPFDGSFRAFGKEDLAAISADRALPVEMCREMQVVAEVLPFRVNSYVMDTLIDWSRVPDDPIFRLTFPQRELLEPRHFERMANAIDAGLSRPALERIARAIRLEMNPHPAQQVVANVPQRRGRPVAGVQRKYRETVLIFPAQGQTCHSYCTFCFRWPQFVMKDLAFATDESRRFADFIREEKALSDVLVTGGDPLVMRSKVLERYVLPFLAPGFEHIRNIRIGTKSVAFWPQRFVTDRDADDILRLFERVVASGKHLALMAHYSHPREMSTSIAQEAIRRIRSTGAEIRTQSPVVRSVNDDPNLWAELWREQVRLGLIPYYMFVERNTGAWRYFQLPLARTWEIYNRAYRQVSGLARTARGPSMSAAPGKVLVEGTAEIHGARVFVLSFLQARDPTWVGRPFFARFDPTAAWLDQLRPAFGERFFFED